MRGVAIYVYVSYQVLPLISSLLKLKQNMTVRIMEYKQLGTINATGTCIQQWEQY